jgi:DNA-binding transcriptional regulator YiaG
MSWQNERQMDGSQLMLALDDLQIDRSKLSRYLGVSYRQVIRWAKNERPIPTTVALLISCMRANRVRPLVPKKVPGTY